MVREGPIAQPGQSCRLITGWSQVQILVGPHQYESDFFQHTREVTPSLMRLCVHRGGCIA